MCYKPLSLKNPVKQENRLGHDKVRIKAQCNNCPSCRRVKQNDWLVRAYFEFIESDKKAYFLTLDFDDFHLPRYKGVPCFDSDKIKHFLYRLRRHLPKFRYLYVTEYGGFLRRPHYHMLLLFDSFVNDLSVFKHVKQAWTYGHFTNVESIDSVQHDKLSALRYITSYSVKDISFDFTDTDKTMPLCYRPRVQASKGFGIQPLMDGRITFDMIKNGDSIALPLGKGGKLVKFSIPRYYEMQLCYDRKFVDGKTILRKNEKGLELTIARTNRCYVQLIRNFFATRHQQYNTEQFFQDSWKEVVYSCLENFDDFKEFIYYRPFIDFIQHDWYHDNIRKELIYRPNWDYYNRAIIIYEQYKADIDKLKCQLETNELILTAKNRAFFKLRHNPRLRRYLVKQHFDFSQLY